MHKVGGAVDGVDDEGWFVGKGVVGGVGFFAVEAIHPAPISMMLSFFLAGEGNGLLVIGILGLQSRRDHVLHGLVIFSDQIRACSPRLEYVLRSWWWTLTVFLRVRRVDGWQTAGNHLASLESNVNEDIVNLPEIERGLS